MHFPSSLVFKSYSEGSNVNSINYLNTDLSTYRPAGKILTVCWRVDIIYSAFMRKNQKQLGSEIYPKEHLLEYVNMYPSECNQCSFTTALSSDHRRSDG